MKKKHVIPPKRKALEKRKTRKAVTQQLPKIVPKATRTGVLGASATDSGGSNNLLLIETMLAIAIAFFAFGALPTAYVRWRPLASLVARRHVEMTLLGSAFLFAAGLALVFGRGL